MDPGPTTPADGAEAERAVPASWARRAWERSAAVGRNIVSLTGGLIAVLTIAVGIGIVVESVVEKTVTIRPLSVPKALSDDGISPEVVALNLRDGLNTFVGDVRRDRGWDATEAMDPEELPDVAVPSVGLSAQALAADVRAFFKIQSRTVISGEVVSRGDSHMLTLRLNGRPFFRSSRGYPRDRLDGMIAEGVRATLDLTQPVVAAAVAYDDGDSRKAIALCDAVIGQKLTGQPQDRHARTLKSRALASLGRIPEAVAEIRTLFALYPWDDNPHNNLGELLVAQGRPDEAVAEFRAAIALAPNHGNVHENLGKVLLSTGRVDEGMREIETGVAVTPQLFSPHMALGLALRARGRDDEALEQYRIAAPLSPNHAGPHRSLGDAFRALGQREEALAEYRKAAALDPASAISHRDLAAALDDLGRGAEASAEREAADAAEGPRVVQGGRRRGEGE